MDDSGAAAPACRRCGSRLRHKDPWCSLCYTRADSPRPATGSPARVPPQRRAPEAPAATGATGAAGASLVGGQVPDEVIDRLMAGLVEESARATIGSWRIPPAVVASGGAALVLVSLLVILAGLGRLL